jgi:hypothetical protein
VKKIMAWHKTCQNRIPPTVLFLNVTMDDWQCRLLWITIDRNIYNRMRFVVYESQTPRFAMYGPTKNKEIVKSVRRFSSDTLKLCDLLANIDIELMTDNGTF